MELDLNDPTTWPDDLDELERLANEKPADETDVKEEPKAEEPKAEEPKAEEPKAEEPKAEEPKAEEPQAEGLSIDGIPVLTKDGKHTIPHNVLANARREAAELRAQLKALQEKEAEKPAEPDRPETREKVADPSELSDAELATIEKIREAVGDEVADAQLGQMKVMKALQAKLAGVADLETKVKQREEVEQQTEEQRIQSAIDNSPLMAAWQAAENKDYFNRAVALNSTLIKTDPEYAQLSWAERFAKLPQKVESVYGTSPEGKTLVTPPATKAPEKPDQDEDSRVAAALAAADKAKKPTSLTEMPAGEADVAEGLTKFEAMEGRELQDFMNKAAEDPEKFADLLMNFSL